VTRDTVRKKPRKRRSGERQREVARYENMFVVQRLPLVSGRACEREKEKKEKEREGKKR